VRQILEHRFVRFLLVGVLNTVFGYGIFAVALLLGLHYALASALATVSGILFNFKTMGTLVFGRPDHRLLGRFLGVYGFIYVLGVLCLKLAHQLDLNLFLVGAFLILPLAVVSFMLNWLFVFGVRE
jgi:putative flippase GtrA